MKDLFKEFCCLCKVLNGKLGIVPVLYGSLGLEQIIDEGFNPVDIDMLIPEEYFNEKWELLRSIVEKTGYELINSDEHEFVKDNIKIAFANEDILMNDLFINPQDLKYEETDSLKYRVLTLFDYFKVYKYSVDDGYRRNKNNGKDLIKIEVIKEAIIGKIRKGR